VRFLSDRPGPGNNFSMTENLPANPKAMPTVKRPGHDVTHWFELSVAPWFSMPVYNLNSYPLGACTPKADSNVPHGRFLGGRPGVRGVAIPPAGLRLAPGRDKLRLDALVLGADYLEP
jgi:hypothetical protein